MRSLYGYVRQDPHTKAYRLGLKLLHLGQATRAQINLRDEAMAYLQVLASQTQELANLVIPSGFQATVIGQSYGRQGRASSSQLH